MRFQAGRQTVNTVIYTSCNICKTVRRGAALPSPAHSHEHLARTIPSILFISRGPTCRLNRTLPTHTPSINPNCSFGGFVPSPQRRSRHQRRTLFSARSLRSSCPQQAWNSPPPNKLAPGVLPSFLEVPSEVPGKEVLVQIKVTQIAPAAQNVVGDLQEAGGAALPGAVNLSRPGPGKREQATLNQFHWRAPGFLHLEAGPRVGRK